MQFTDRWYQTESVEAIGPYYYGPKAGKNPLIGLPTGTGKSVVIARFNQKVMQHFPSHRILNLTHSKELVGQNAKKLQAVWPQAPMGVLSSGLKKFDTDHPILYAGIQTLANRVEQIGFRHAVFIDEAHMVGESMKSQYRTVLEHLKKLNPDLFIGGTSATLYRERQGGMTEGSVFNEIAYDLTDMVGFNRLLDEGFLAPLTPQPTDLQVDISDVHIRGGEFIESEAQAAFDQDRINRAACAEIVEKGWNRHCWLIFTNGIQHCENVAMIFSLMGIKTAYVHSKRKGMVIDEKDNEKLHINDYEIKRFKDGRAKCLVNADILTTGFDHPPIDLIGMLKLTNSTAKHVQMAGRGTRIYDGRYANQYIVGFEYIKSDCLYLDFARNVSRLGPINDPVKPKRPGDPTGDVPIKLCEWDKLQVNWKKVPPDPEIVQGCKTLNHASARVCQLCKREFSFIGSQIFKTAGTDEIIRREEEPIYEWRDVDRTFYSRIGGKNPIMKVSHVCGVQSFDELVCLQHTTNAAFFAREWWKQHHHSGLVPQDTDEGLVWAKEGRCKTPRRVYVHVNQKPYPKIIRKEY